MITAIIETRDDEVALAHALAALVPAATEGILSDVVVIDHDSSDGTLVVAEAAGCAIVRARAVSGDPRRFAAERARGHWLLFLAPTTILRPGWQAETAAVMAVASATGRERTTIAALGVNGAPASWFAQLRIWKRGPNANRAILVSRQLFLERAGEALAAPGYLLRSS